jgi:hypothetical protein
MGSNYSRWNQERSEQYKQIKTVNRATFTVDAPADTNSGHLKKADSKLAPYAFTHWDGTVSSTAMKANEIPRPVKKEKAKKKDKSKKDKKQIGEEEEGEEEEQVIS